MQVKGVNHVNIIAVDLDKTVDFYEKVLGMRAAIRPMDSLEFKGCWISDHTGAPIIHIQAHNPERHGSLDEQCKSTGAIDHVALNCHGFEYIVNHCRQLGIDIRVNDRRYGDLRQVFVIDPNCVKLELNFLED